MAISNRVKMLVEGKRRLIDEYDENFVKIARDDIASGALDVEIQDKEK